MASWSCPLQAQNRTLKGTVAGSLKASSQSGCLVMRQGSQWQVLGGGTRVDQVDQLWLQLCGGGGVQGLGFRI